MCKTRLHFPCPNNSSVTLTPSDPLNMCVFIGESANSSLLSPLHYYWVLLLLLRSSSQYEHLYIHIACTLAEKLKPIILEIFLFLGGFQPKKSLCWFHVRCCRLFALWTNTLSVQNFSRFCTKARRNPFCKIQDFHFWWMTDMRDSFIEYMASTIFFWYKGNVGVH